MSRIVCRIVVVCVVLGWKRCPQLALLSVLDARLRRLQQHLAVLAAVLQQSDESSLMGIHHKLKKKKYMKKIANKARDRVEQRCYVARRPNSLLPSLSMPTLSFLVQSL
jgi:hypothetical protein